MKVTKNGVFYQLKDEVQIEAFVKSGWKAVEEQPADSTETDNTVAAKRSTRDNTKLEKSKSGAD